MTLRCAGLMCACALLVLPAYQLKGQSTDTSAASAPAATTGGKLVLVLPFQNRTKLATEPGNGAANAHAQSPTGSMAVSSTSVGWIAAAAPEILNRRLQSAGFLPISREDRLYALDHMGLPLNFEPSRATTLRMAQLLGAEYVILGDYSVEERRLTFHTQVLDVQALKLGPTISSQGDLLGLLSSLNSLAWQVAHQLDPSLPIAVQTFISAGNEVRIEAFEHYIRGLLAPGAEEKLQHFREATRISPGYVPAWLALGETYFNNQQYEQAAATLARIPKSDISALQASFYRGLSLFYTGNYPRAEEAFASIATVLPLPEVVNNWGVAQSRRGHDGTPRFQQATVADPSDEDYRFNLALSLHNKGDQAGAEREISQALQIRPTDSEAKALASIIKGTPQLVAGSGNQPELLQRIKRTYNEASYRQAAAAIEEIQMARIETQSPEAQAAELTHQGQQYLDRGLILEAERHFQSALHASPSSAAAHAGLAQVRERTSNAEAARSEAKRSLDLGQNAPAYLVLARLDLSANNLDAAAQDIKNALRLEPGNSQAQALRQTLESRGKQLP